MGDHAVEFILTRNNHIPLCHRTQWSGPGPHCLVEVRRIISTSLEAIRTLPHILLEGQTSRTTTINLRTSHNLKEQQVEISDNIHKIFILPRYDIWQNSNFINVISFRFYFRNILSVSENNKKGL